MAALLVAISIMMVMMTVAMPVYKQAARREKEDELVFRGEQYARAIGLFKRKFANANPPTIDVLIEQHFLRRKYKDPITNQDFIPLMANQPMPGQAQPPGRGSTGLTAPNPLGTGPGPGLSSPTGAPGTSPIGTPGAGGSGGIIGVASKSKDTSIRLYKGRNHYNEWAFVYTQPAMVPGAGAPGTVPGGQRGQPQRGGPNSPFGSPFGTEPGSGRSPGRGFQPPGSPFPNPPSSRGRGPGQ
jgi:type II secretory pathway pseudopilin PulG